MAKGTGVDDTLVLDGKNKSSEPKLPGNIKYSLVVIAGKSIGKEFSIGHWTVIIGRDASVSDFVIDDPGASRSHACLEYEGKTFVIEDLESTNGLLLNEKPANRAELNHGDKIAIGKTVLQFIVETSKEGAKGGKVYQIDSL